MNNQQIYSDLGFDIEIETTNNYPEGFVTTEQLDLERKTNLEIIEDNGGFA